MPCDQAIRLMTVSGGNLVNSLPILWALSLVNEKAKGGALPLGLGGESLHMFE